MPDFLNQFLNLWKRLTMGQRIGVGAAAAGTLGLLATLVYLGSQPEYGVLFSDLKSSDAQAIVEKLKASNVAYKLANGGTMISVPSEKVSELRLQMAGSNTLTGGHVGFDIFDRGSLGTTDFTQKVNYQRALEGELAKTLEAMDEVETARVHITAPRESVFAEKAEKGKASVVLRIRANRELSRERTEAVVNLIASASEGLDPSDVAVMDTKGRLLTSPGRNTPGGIHSAAFNSHIEAKQRLETETAARIVSLLEPVVGQGRVQADVAAEVDFSQVEQTEEKYDPKSSVIRSQQTTNEYRTPGSSFNGGLVGARANDPSLRQPNASPTPTPAPGTPAATAQPTPTLPPQISPDQRNASTVNYEIDKTIKRTIGGVGKVTRMSASVLVDNKLVSGNSVARTPEELKKIQELVGAAIGADQQRGDLVVVESFSFDRSNAEPSKLSFLDKYREFTLAGIKYGSLVLAAALLLFFVVRPAHKALQTATAEQQKLLAAEAAGESGESSLTEGEDAVLAERRGGTLPASEAAQLEGLGAPKTVAELEAEMALGGTPATGERKVLSEPLLPTPAGIREQLAERVRREPEAVAITLRGWLQEQNT